MAIQALARGKQDWIQEDMQRIYTTAPANQPYYAQVPYDTPDSMEAADRLAVSEAEALPVNAQFFSDNQA